MATTPPKPLERQTATLGAVNQLADFLIKGIARVQQRADKRVEELEARVAILEAESLRYRGIYDAETWYKQGDVVTRSGSLWRCQAEWSQGATPGGPDERDRAWVLVLKRGAAS